MKKLLFAFTSCLVLSGTVMGVTGCNKDKDDEKEETPVIINVPDAKLAAQIRLKLKLDATADITKDDILKLDTLNLDAENDRVDALVPIADLTGLEHAENLSYLHLGFTSVVNLTPIKDLKKVTYLRINNTKVTTLAPVSAYTTLTYFNANTVTTLTDISPLAGNKGLKEIILRSVPFGDAGMATIKNFTSLYRINMRQTGVTDITVLAELMAAGALLDTTPGAAEAGGAVLDLRQNSGIDCNLLAPYASKIANGVEGCSL
jgi:hypothetical protein